MRDTMSTRRSSSTRQTKKNPNITYLTPPTPAPQEIIRLERGFTLDCIACSSISTDYSKTNPKVAPIIMPYNSQKDKHCNQYFRFHGVGKTLDQTGQSKGGCSIDGPVIDKFQARGAGFQYLSLRNQFGAGHSPETVNGHAQFMQGVAPIVGYNGLFGYRRNTPWLRQKTSPFGTSSTLKTH
ncbi:hypothetical protein CAPTEDRAFT_220747 [Capitella teleta]|uniref:Uncharacterized protein n=1 Tax=Capitella teleta TaxID=283909 RepID=R7U6T3_CAPTE|nr:hypothetical protein CAPTEDRAFT_220747 [Capitella teleta]|eukprot:ELU01856.1 hypothetical protein CAPTEDRAFT_220747 [Capitella teleta]